MKPSIAGGLLLVLGCLSAVDLPAADLVVLTPKTWEEFSPAGKEVDCIYGDLVLRNDKLIAVIANPIPGRNANMTVKDVGGCIIDLSVLQPQSDQLSAYYPGGKQMAWRVGKPITDIRDASSVHITLRAEASADQPAAELTYTLKEGSPYILVETIYINQGSKALEIPLVDDVRADTTFEKTPNGEAALFWAYDPWFGQAYGIVPEGVGLQSTSTGNASTVRYPKDGKSTVALAAGEKLRLARHIFPGKNLFDIRAIANDLAGVEQQAYSLLIRDTAGTAVADAQVLIQRDGDTTKPGVAGRTDDKGRLKFQLPAGTYSAQVRPFGLDILNIVLKAGDLTLEVPAAGRVTANITDEKHGPIPCKVEFRGRDDTKDPYFGPQSGEHALHNLYYSHDGVFSQILPPGKYDVIVSHGPEYDAVFLPLEIRYGQATPLTAVLKRTVKTDGWISADFHNHASPSGDNTSSQYGRVLNLLCEQIEFAPCTEHNRVTTYAPHLERLQVAHLMGTCTGIEMTGSPLPLNHQNAFPLVHKPRTQDGGGPLSDVSPEAQIARLALWDNRSEKLVQQNHPDLGRLFYDKDGDGKPDGGFATSLPFMDVIEAHPLQSIFEPARIQVKGQPENNRILNWLQLLNQGYRIPGTVCTDAHYNFHGSGFLRIYLRSPTDDPAKVKTLDVVHAAEKGNIVMTNGPFLEVSADIPGGLPRTQAISGDEMTASSGKVDLQIRVQCPNWCDINRVQVAVNGRMPKELNFTRESHPEMFGSGVIKFDRKIPVELASDAHLIVIAAGEKLKIGPVMGPDHGKQMPIAVSNPIYVDVDGGGFKPNADTLGAPLPVGIVKEGAVAK
jgi:hypothetical protein